MLLMCKAAEWGSSPEGCFLNQANGSAYIPVFRSLRLNYIVTEYNSARIVENDHLLPHGLCVSVLNLVACWTCVQC